MFELLLLVTAGGAVICFLKGRWLKGLAALAALVGGVALAFAVDSGSGMLLMPVAALAAIVLAVGPAEPGSYWDRQSPYQPGEPRPIDEERKPHRLRRTLVGALLGMGPGVLFIAAVTVVVQLFDLSGDTAQIAFLGLPITFFGLIFGALIGYQWVPKKRSDERRKTGRPQSSSG